MTEQMPDDTLAGRISAMQSQMGGQLPAEAAAAFAAEQAGFAAAGAPDGIAEVGSAMPDGKLLDVHGDPTSLVEAQDGRTAVVVFYRGAWCPYCNMTLRTYQDQLAPALHERGVALIAISGQPPDGSLTMQDKHALTYAVLSDPGNTIAAALGIRTAPGDAVRTAQLSLGLDVAAANADGTTAIPMPSTVIVDPAGTIGWIDVHRNYATRTEPSEILDALDRL